MDNDKQNMAFAVSSVALQNREENSLLLCSTPENKVFRKAPLLLRSQA